MHYITGTSFTIDPRINRGVYSRYDDKLIPGQTYRLIHILKESDTLQYVFADARGNRVTVPFETARHADNLIAKYRKEAIPDYDNMQRPDF